MKLPPLSELPDSAADMARQRGRGPQIEVRRPDGRMETKHVRSVERGGRGTVVELEPEPFEENTRK